MPELTPDAPAPTLPGADILNLDKIAADAWPAAVRKDMDGWVLRHSGGISRRADSVAPFAVNGAVPDLEERLAAVENAYRAVGTPPRFQISPAAAPEGLDGVLAARGYEVEAPVYLMTRATGPDGRPGADVRLSGEADAAWWALYVEGFGRDARDIVAGARERPVFAHVADRDGTLRAIGLGVEGGDFLGIFAMYTRPAERGHGLGAAVIEAFAAEAVANRRGTLYLQVERKNLDAIRLYTRLGFETAYAYHYRTLWTET